MNVQAIYKMKSTTLLSGVALLACLSWASASRITWSRLPVPKGEVRHENTWSDPSIRVGESEKGPMRLEFDDAYAPPLITQPLLSVNFHYERVPTRTVC